MDAGLLAASGVAAQAAGRRQHEGRTVEIGGMARITSTTGPAQDQHPKIKRGSFKHVR
ncbi:hypothetical protein ACS0X5_32450 [Burkholderia gladioli]|uniref:hypothetical protein n=1 Tax=Burkholderia gladioli TaxID=28095 RepID=UPI001641BEED|nr:hypothetical protein [Burkholderia gladioli]